MKRSVRRSRVLSGEVRVPPDKSISHRAVILNSIACGEARVGNFSQAADCASTVACLRALGADIDSCDNGDLVVRGRGEEGLVEPDDVLDAGNSGTTMRLLAGLLAAQPFLSVITGDASLRCRPMGRVLEPLRMMGANVRARCSDTLAPLVIGGGGLRGIRYRLPVASAQLKSSLLLAGLFADGDTVLEESMATRDHTERMLVSMGSSIRTSGPTIAITSGGLTAIDITVPGDVSAAAFWLVAAAIHDDAHIRLPGTGLNPTRTGIIDVLRSMGADVAVSNERDLSGEPMGDVEIRSSSLTGTEVDGDLVPRVIDEMPLIALAACFARGRTVIRDAQELRLKETDRIRSTVKELEKMGAQIEELPDGMIVHGARGLRGAACSSHGDHRLAMMLGAAALIAEGETLIDGAEAADISYPTFWDDLDRVQAS